MSFSKSRLAFSDCYDLMDRALTEPRGVRARFDTPKAAYHYRFRLLHARNIDRKDNADALPPSDPLHGRSVYDILRTSVDEEGQYSYLRLEKTIPPTYIEPIPENADVSNNQLPSGQDGHAEGEEGKMPSLPAIKFSRRV